MECKLKDQMTVSRVFAVLFVAALLWAVSATWLLTQANARTARYEADFANQVRLICQQGETLGQKNAYIIDLHDQYATASLPNLAASAPAHVDKTPQELLATPPPIR